MLCLFVVIENDMEFVKRAIVESKCQVTCCRLVLILSNMLEWIGFWFTHLSIMVKIVYFSFLNNRDISEASIR